MVIRGRIDENGKEHKIKKPLIFLMIALAAILLVGSYLFYVKNNVFIKQKIMNNEDGLAVDQILIKVLIKSNEFTQKQVRIFNGGMKEMAASAGIEGLAGIVETDDSPFVLSPGQTKILTINFFSSIPEQGIEHRPDIYVGKLVIKSGEGRTEVPIVIEIESRDVLFDMNLNPIAIERKVLQGSETTIEVRLFNLESIESENVDVEYFVKDVNSNTILSESETVVVKTQASFFKTISIPKNLKPGTYVFGAKSRFGSSTGTSSYTFEVISEGYEKSFLKFCTNDVLCLGISFTSLLLLFAFIAYFYFFAGAFIYEKVRKAENEEQLRRLPKKRWTHGLLRMLALIKKILGGKILELLHKMGLYKTPEERKKIEMEKKKLEEARRRLAEKSRLEEGKKRKAEEMLRLEEEKKKKLEERQMAVQKLREERKRMKAEEKLRLEEEMRRKAEEERIRQEEETARREEEERKQNEMKEQKELMRKAKLQQKRIEAQKLREETERRKAEEMERMKEEQEKLKELRIVKRIEKEVNRTKGHADSLHEHLKKMESEKGLLADNLKKADAILKNIDGMIAEKYAKIEQAKHGKAALLQEQKEKFDELDRQYPADEEARRDRIKELKAGLENRKAEQLKELELELKKMTPEKRKKLEKWKRMELEARFKLEEHNIEEEISKEEILKKKGARELGKEHNITLGYINKKQKELKSEIEALKFRKQEIVLQKTNTPKQLLEKDKEIEDVKEKLQHVVKKLDKLEEKLSMHKPRPLVSWLDKVFRRREEEKRAIEKEKGSIEGWLEKDKSQKKIKDKVKSSQKESAYELFGKQELKTISKELEKCGGLLNNARKAINDGDMGMATALYSEARERYVGLDYAERKEIYHELVDMYNSLKK